MSNEIQELTAEIKKFSAGQQAQIDALRKILVGNGNIGLCETVRQMSGQMKALWTLVGIVGACIITSVVKLVFFTG